VKKDDEICLKYLIKAIAELNKNYNSLNSLKDEYKDAGLNPLLDAIAHLLFHPYDVIIAHYDLVLGKSYDDWIDPEEVDVYFKGLIDTADMAKKHFTARSIRDGELLLLDFRLELL